MNPWLRFQWVLLGAEFGAFLGWLVVTNPIIKEAAQVIIFTCLGALILNGIIALAAAAGGHA